MLVSERVLPILAGSGGRFINGKEACRGLARKPTRDFGRPRLRLVLKPRW